MKSSKIAILILTGIVSSTIFISPLPVSANELNNNNKIIESKKEMTVNEAIKIIENKYLSVINDKFIISSDAKKEIPENILKELTESINFTNNNIEQKNLKIKTTNENKFNIEIEEKYKNSNYELNNKRVRRSNDGKSNFYKKYGYKFKFFWWGYAAWIKKAGTDELITGLESLQNLFGGAGIVSGVIVGGLTTVASGVGYLAFNALVTQAKLARSRTGSCITYCYGSPKNGQVYKITPTW